MLRKASWFSCLLILTISCLDEPDCFRLSNTLAAISFKKMLGGQADTVVVYGISANGTDSIFNERVLTTALYLPLNIFTDQTSYVIKTVDEDEQLILTNLLQLGYAVKTQFVSEECGARYVLSDLNVINHDFADLRVVATNPASSQEGTNIEIYRCPITNRMKLAFRQLQNTTSVPLALKINSIDDDLGVTRYVDTTLSAVLLPLNPEGNSNQFQVNFAGEATPGIFNVTYNRSTRRFFEVCGFQQLFHDLLVTASDVDSLHIVTDSIQDPPVTNVMAFRCPETNLMQVHFRQPTSPRDDTVNIVSITDDYSGKIWYSNVSRTSVLLPLNGNETTTNFTFILDTGTKVLTIDYLTTPKKLFNACGTQPLFSELEAASTFTGVGVTRDSVQFPVITNVEIIQ